jgi:hypothetical protein
MGVVAYDSEATNILPNTSICSNTCVFLRDTCNGALPGCVPTTTLISVAIDGTAADGGNPSMSGDEFVAFNSNATDIVSGDATGLGDEFLRDTRQPVASQAPLWCRRHPQERLEMREAAFPPSARLAVSSLTNLGPQTWFQTGRWCQEISGVTPASVLWPRVLPAQCALTLPQTVPSRTMASSAIRLPASPPTGVWSPSAQPPQTRLHPMWEEWETSTCAIPAMAPLLITHLLPAWCRWETTARWETAAAAIWE